MWHRILAGVVMAIAATAAMAPRVAQAQRRSDSVVCRSDNFRLRRCDVPWRDARLVEQISGTQCIRGRNWGVDRGGIWVDNGCAGRFVEARGGGRPGRPGWDDDDGGWRPGADWDTDIRFRCESRDFRYNLCQVDTGRGGRVYIDRQISDTRCIEGRTWGYNRAGVWVDGGCAADFVIERRWR